MSILVPLGLVFSSVGFTPALAQLVPVPVYGAQPTGFGAVELGLVGALLLYLGYCGDPPIQSCYKLSSVTGRFLGSTAHYTHITDTTKLFKIKCTIRDWESLPPCPISCGDPPVKPFLSLLDITSGTLEGDTRYYICENRDSVFDKDFPTSSPCPSVTCQTNGKWTDFNFTCNFFGDVIATNRKGSRSGTTGTIISPNRPGDYLPPNNAVYRYSIVTAGTSLSFDFNGDFGIRDNSDLSIHCGLNTTNPTISFFNRETRPPQIVCPTGCANVLFFAVEGGVGSLAGFDLTWKANP